MMAKLGALVLGVVLLAGCGAHEAAAPAAPRHHPSPEAATTAGCPSGLFRRGGHVPPPDGHVPPGFRTAWVLRCSDGTQRRPGRGEWETAVTERADTNAAALVRALRQPPGHYGLCTLDYRGTPYFALVDAHGKAVRPVVAIDNCGHPSGSVIQALNALPFRTVAVRPLRQLRTEKEVTTDCPVAYKDMVAIEHAAPAPARRLWPTPAKELLICLYGRISGGNIPVGQFSTGRIVRGPVVQRLVSTLDSAGAARTCSLRHSRYALVALGPGEQWGAAVIELDGCHRMLSPDLHDLAQLDASTVQQIVRAAGAG